MKQIKAQNENMRKAVQDLVRRMNYLEKEIKRIMQ